MERLPLPVDFSTPSVSQQTYTVCLSAGTPTRPIIHTSRPKSTPLPQKDFMATQKYID